MTKPSVDRIIRDSRAECLVLSQGEVKVMIEEIVRLRAALAPFAAARTEEGYFGTVPDSQAYVEARLALGLPWKPRHGQSPN